MERLVLHLLEQKDCYIFRSPLTELSVGVLADDFYSFRLFYLKHIESEIKIQVIARTRDPVVEK